MGNAMKTPWCGCGGKNGVRSNRTTSLEASLFSLAWPLRRLIGAGRGPNTGQVITPTARKARKPGVDGGHPLDGGSRRQGRCSRPSSCCPGLSRRRRLPKSIYRTAAQHVWVAAARQAAHLVISGGGKWVEITANADPLYQHLIVTAERKFWRCVETGDFIAVAVAWNASSTCRAVVKVFLVPRAR